MQMIYFFVDVFLGLVQKIHHSALNTKKIILNNNIQIRRQYLDECLQDTVVVRARNP